jgi:hypothetical protein
VRLKAATGGSLVVDLTILEAGYSFFVFLFRVVSSFTFAQIKLPTVEFTQQELKK